MNGGQFIVALFCLGTIGLFFIGFELLVFRIACAICSVEQPSFIRTISVLAAIKLIPWIVIGLLSGLLYAAYEKANYPLWEAGIVWFLLALPIQMALCGVIHAKIMNIRLGEGVAVWFVEKTVKSALMLAVVGVITLFILFGRGN